MFATAGLAYRFLLHEAGTILRLSWFPILVVTIIQYFAARAQFAAMRSALEAGDIRALSGFSPTWHWQILGGLVAILGTAIVAVALHRVILFGDRRPSHYIHLAFGRIEMLFALLPVVVLLPIALLAFVVFGLTGAAAPTPGGAAWAIIFIGYLLLWAVFIFAAVRLAIIFPVTVIEGRYDFGQAWSLTRGNFWRIVGLWIVVFIPLLIVVAVMAFVITPPFPPASVSGKGGKNELIAIFEQIESRLFVQTIFSFVWSIVGGALAVAVLSYSYKALRGLQPDDVWT